MDTIDNALKIVTSDSEASPNNVKNTNVGLSLVLLGLAEKQAARLVHLTKVTQDLEKRVFSDATLSQLDERTLLGMYKLSVEALNTSSSYIQQTLNTLKWKDLEMALIEMAARTDVETGTKELTGVASELLQELAKYSQSKQQSQNIDSE